MLSFWSDTGRIYGAGSVSDSDPLLHNLCSQHCMYVAVEGSERWGNLGVSSHSHIRQWLHQQAMKQMAMREEAPASTIRTAPGSASWATSRSWSAASRNPTAHAISFDHLFLSFSQTFHALKLVPIPRDRRRVVSNFAFSFAIISVLTGVTTTYNTGLRYGGPASATLGWVVVTVMNGCIALAMAEICSAYPTSGGLYYWSARLAGEDWAPLASWMTGWFVTLLLIETNCLSWSSFCNSAI